MSNPQGNKRAVNEQGVGAQQAAYQPDRSHRPVRVSRSGNSPGSGLKAAAELGWQAYAHYQKVARQATPLKRRPLQANPCWTWHLRVPRRPPMSVTAGSIARR